MANILQTAWAHCHFAALCVSFILHLCECVHDIAYTSSTFLFFAKNCGRIDSDGDSTHFSHSLSLSLLFSSHLCVYTAYLFVVFMENESLAHIYTM